MAASLCFHVLCLKIEIKSCLHYIYNICQGLASISPPTFTILVLSIYHLFLALTLYYPLNLQFSKYCFKYLKVLKWTYFEVQSNIELNKIQGYPKRMRFFMTTEPNLVCFLIFMIPGNCILIPLFSHPIKRPWKDYIQGKGLNSTLESSHLKGVTDNAWSWTRLQYYWEFF